MSADNQEIALREELRGVEEQLADLRRTAVELREQIGERSYGPTDPAEMATVITAAEEQEALVGLLEGRRAELLRRLSEAS